MAWFFKKKKKVNLKIEDRISNLKKSVVPKHVAIIMDGNGRWAKEKMLPRIVGHKQGMDQIRVVTQTAHKVGIKELTIYAFSTENWKRSQEEVSYLMKLPIEFFDNLLPELMDGNVKLSTIGEDENVPQATLDAINRGKEATKNNTGLILNVAFNYGSRAEIMKAVNEIASDAKAGKIHAHVTEEQFSNYLMTSHLSDPDLLIRTSGEQRLSNFLLWQLAYTEFYFSDVLWPDFGEEEFLDAVESFQKRQRRYGGREE